MSNQDPANKNLQTLEGVFLRAVLGFVLAREGHLPDIIDNTSSELLKQGYSEQDILTAKQSVMTSVKKDLCL